MSEKGISSFDPANLCQIAIVVKSVDETFVTSTLNFEEEQR